MPASVCAAKRNWSAVRDSAAETSSCVSPVSYTHLILDERGTMVARVTLQCGIRTLYGSYNQRLWPLSMPQRCRQ